MGPTVAALVPVPFAVSAALADDLAIDLLALRPLDPILPSRIVAPSAARERIRAGLENAGFTLATAETTLDPTMPLAGISPDKAARFRNGPVDIHEPSKAARPLLALPRFLERPRGVSLADHARERAREGRDPADGFALAVERAARERDLESIVLSLQRTRGSPPAETAAFFRHRVAGADLGRGTVAAAASVLAADGAAGVALAAREALGFAARSVLGLETPGLLALEGQLARELDVFLGDALVAAAPPPGRALAFLEPETLALPWPPAVTALVEALGPPRARAEAPALPRPAALAVHFLQALAGFARKTTPAAREDAARTLGGSGVSADQALALSLASKQAGIAPGERRRHHRRLARALDDRGRRAIERALPELTGTDGLVAAGLAAETRASSRAELVSGRRRACALTLARTAELAREEPGLRSELERARALLDHARSLPDRNAASPRGTEPDWELVALGIEEALLAPDAERSALAARARPLLERWASEKERAPLGFLAPALRLLTGPAAEDPFPGETRDPRRVEVRILYHLGRHARKATEPPRALVEALIERKRSGVQLSDLARKLEPVLASAFLFATLPRSLAAALGDELGKPDELRIFRRLPGSDTFEGRFERRFVLARFYPEDDPPLERARTLIREHGSGPGGVARPLAALESSHVRGGLGVGWALVTAAPPVPGGRLSPEDVPSGPAAWGFLAGLAEALAAQHAWGLVHGPLRLDGIEVSPAGALFLTDFDLEASLSGEPGLGRAQDMAAFLAAADEALDDPAGLATIGAATGDLAAEGAAARLALALRERARTVPEAGDALAAIRARRSVDREELRAILRDALSGDGLPRSLAEIEARVPSYLAWRASLDQETVRAELLELAEEGWASGELTLEVDARNGTWRLAEAVPA